jgi:cell wall-associated NlpC family hydrolase/phage-related protein
VAGATIAEAMLDLRVDSRKVKGDVEKGIDSADTSAAGRKAGTSFGRELAPQITTSIGRGMSKVDYKSTGRKSGEEFGISFAASTVAAIGPGILGMGAKGSLITMGGTLAAGLLPGLVAGLGAGAVAGGGLLTMLLGGKALIGSKKEQGPLYAAAQQAADSFQQAFLKASGSLAPTLQSVFGQIPKILAQMTPALTALFAGAATMIQPLVSGISNLADTVLPLFGQAFRAVAPLLQPMINGITLFIQGLMPGLISLLQQAGPAIQAISGFLGTLGAGLGAMFAAFAPGLAASGALLQTLGQILASLLPMLATVAGNVAAALAPAFAAFGRALTALTPFLIVLGQLIGDIAAAMIGDLAWALDLLARLFTAISPALTTFLAAIRGVFVTLENSGVFQAFGNALSQVVPLIAQVVNTILTGLTPILPPLIGLFGQMSGILAGVLAGAMRALIPVLTQIITQGLQLLAQILPVIIPPMMLFAQTIGKALLDALAQVAPILAQLATVVFTALAAVLRQLAPLVPQLAAAFASILTALLPLLPALIRLTADVLTVMIGLLPLIVPLLTAFVQLFTPVLVGLVQALAAALLAVINAIPAPVLVAIAAAFGAVVLGLKAWAIAQDIVRLGTIAWTAVQWLLNAALTANPIGIVIVAIAALAAALVIAWTKSAAFRDLLIGAWNAIRTAAVAVWNAIASFFTGWFNAHLAMVRAVIAAVSTVITVTWNAIRSTAIAVWNAVSAFFTGWWNAHVALVRAVIGAVASVLSSTWNAISGTARSVWNGISSFFSGWWAGLRSSVSVAVNGIASLISGVWNGIKNTASSAWGAIKQVVNSAWSGIKDVIRAPLVAARIVWNVFAGGVNAVASLFGVRPVPTIPAFAQGGKIPGYGGGDILPFAVKGGGAAMLEPGETVVSKEASRLPYMQAAFSQAGVPGYQLGGVIGFFGNVVKNAVTALIPGGRATVDMAAKIAEVALNTAGIGSGYWPDLIKKIIDSLGSGVKKAVESGAAKVMAATGSGADIARYAESFLGRIPYVWGGTAVPGGADCSGFVQTVYRHFGISAPRTSEAQGAWVRRGAPVSGGLAFYDSPAGGAPPGHVAIVKNAGTVISQGGGMGPNLMNLHGMPLMWTGTPPGGFAAAGAAAAKAASAARYPGTVRAFDRGGRIPEPVLGIGASGRRYRFEAGEDVQSAAAQMATARRLEVMIAQLERLIDTTAAVPAGVGRHVGGAIGVATEDAAHAARYPQGSW